MEEQVPTTNGGTRTVHRLRPEIVEQLVGHCIHVEQGRSGKAASVRPLFERMKRDAATEV